MVSQLNTVYSKINQIVVTGNTDSIRSEAANMALSQARANSIRRILCEVMVFLLQRYPLKVRGEDETLTNCNEALPRAQLIECKQPDRRVTIDLISVFDAT